MPRYFKTTIRKPAALTTDFPKILQEFQDQRNGISALGHCLRSCHGCPAVWAGVLTTGFLKPGDKVGDRHEPLCKLLKSTLSLLY
jgi:hypothetical protein